MGPIISVFVLILIVSILAGLTFLFVSQLKTQSLDVAPRTTVSIINETITFDDVNTIQELSASTLFNVNCGTITYVANETTTGELLTVGNYTQSDCTLINATEMAADGWGGNGTVYVSYPYNYIAPDQANAYNAINDTEAAGAGLTGYLPLIFLTIIFGAILTLVLRIILPYINLGQNMGGF